MLPDVNINFLAVLVAAVAAFVVGFLWYSPKLFGNQWLNLEGFTAKQKKNMKKQNMGKTMLIGFLATLLMAYVLALAIKLAGATGVVEALGAGFWVWAGFILPLVLGPYLWQQKPLGLVWLNGGHWLVVVEVMAIILTLWV